MFENFYGNRQAIATLRQMIETDRIPQTILLEGPQGTGKATLARRTAAALLANEAKIENDDLSLEHNASTIADREKWPAEKRNEDPLMFATHADFVTFAPDGPLRQLSIPQMRLLRDLAQYRPLKGARRVFLIDHIDRANEQAANSLLKTLEEPPEHLIIFLTAENVYDLLPTIRSRAIPIRLSPLSDEDMSAFLASRGDIDRREQRLALANGSPGAAVSIDVDAWEKRRDAMLTLLKVAAGAAPFGSWVKYSESIGASKSEKLDEYLKVLSQLLEDLLLVSNGLAAPRSTDITSELLAIGRRIELPWILAAVRRVNDLAEQIRRNIQKSLALDAFAVELQSLVRVQPIG